MSNSGSVSGEGAGLQALSANPNVCCKMHESSVLFSAAQCCVVPVETVIVGES